MNLAQIVLRKLPTPRTNLLCQNTISKTLLCQKSTKEGSTSSSSSTSSSESEDETKKKTSSSDAVTRLNSLLNQMVTEDYSKTKGTINLSKPPDKKAQGREEKMDSNTTEPVEKQVVNAVKGVAESLGGDTKQTESELLTRLLNPVETHEDSSHNLSNILKGMIIERELKPEKSKAEKVRSVLQKISTSPRTQNKSVVERRPKFRQAPPIVEEGLPENVDLFGSERLGIFMNPSELKDSPQIATWQMLHEKELKLAVTHPPSNHFQQMILWTDQGKLWRFPIDNEFGLEEEKKVYFTDHVFLEEHLEPWCPPKGPLRHFMELVCVGLSKNCYLTVEAKKQHIEWFKNYFDDKKKLLQEVGALQGGQAMPKGMDKQ